MGREVPEMDPVKIKYGLDEMPSFGELLFLGLQWLAIMIPTIVIVGKVVAVLHYSQLAEQIIYVQKVFFIIGISLLLQLLWGHRLPLVVGPATILLVGIAASSSEISSTYTAIAIGGLVLFVMSAAGLFNHLKKLFTAPVVTVILIMIAFTLTPMIIDLCVPPTSGGLAWLNLCFAFFFVFCVFAVSRFVTGFWKSTLIMWSLIAGTIVYHLFFPQGFEMAHTAQSTITADFLLKTKINLSFEPGVILSFLVCFLALSINDLGSIFSVGEVLKLEDIPVRVTRGLSLTGIFNFLAGLWGIIGMVNFSLSPGIIASTGCASRFALVPAGFLLLAISFLPPVITFLSSIPSVVVGGIFIYIMCSQIAAGLTMVLDARGGFRFENGLVIGLPLMLSIIISFLPDNALNTFPVFLRPFLGNGFVVGVLAVLIMEHLIFGKER
jgi:xanthine/uracil permease